MELCQAIGIDLGTTNCCVAGYPPQGSKLEVYTNGIGDRLTPSWVASTPQGAVYGKVAIQQQMDNLENTVYDVKRAIGRQYDDKTAVADRENWPFKIIKCPETGSMKYRLSQGDYLRDYTCEELSGCILRQMKRTAQQKTKRKPKKAVITVPARFGEPQRRATRTAGEIAGLEVMRLLNEPTAAAIAYYGVDNKGLEQDRVLVYDLGGGTFDVSILDCENEVDDFTSLQVKATGGDTHLGGRDFDQKIAQHLATVFETENKQAPNVRKNPKAWNKLLKVGEQAKMELSHATTSRVTVESLIDRISFSTTISRAKFENLINDELQNTKKIVSETIKEAGIENEKINRVLLVGGSTRIPKVKQILSSMFPDAIIDDDLNPDEVVARGAGRLAAHLSGCAGQIGAVCLSDITPLSLGIGLIYDKMSKIIPRGSVIPAVDTYRYYSTQDNVDSIGFSVYEGERPEARSNYLLGHCTVPIPVKKPKGEAEVDVEFRFDENNILNVRARCVGTNKITQLKITKNKINLSEEEVAAMIKDAEENSARDEEWLQQNDARMKLDNLIYDARKSQKYETDASLQQLCSELETIVKVTVIKPRKEYDDGYGKLQQKMK